MLNRPQRDPAAAHCHARLRALTMFAALFTTVLTPTAFAQSPTASATSPEPTSPEALEKLVARIALYPDDLIAIILPASTNPLQIVQADRFLAKRKTDPKTPLDDKWDDAVKSLVNYPEVVTAMSSDLDWTAALGEAVVADPGDVLEAVQAFRRKTQAAGNLKSDQKQTVVIEKEVIKIVPADPQVIYVPQYNPTTVVVTGGYSSWGYYPSPYPVYYYPYPPGAAFATGLIWGAAIGAAWNGGHYATHYGGNANININRNTNINTGNINTGNVNVGSGNVNRPSTKPSGAQGAGSSQWASNKQPGQVSRSVGATPPARVGDSRAATGAGGAGVSSSAARQSSTGSAGANTMAARPTGSPSTGGGGGGGGAFDGYGSANRTQMDSSRGAASRSSAGAGSGRAAGGGGSAGRARR
jgi:hypothetical protein